MRAIIVDDEPLMIKSFLRLSKDIDNLEVIGTFESAEDALRFTKCHPYEVAFLDIEMPDMNGVQCAEKIREIYPEMLIVFGAAFESYISESNRIGADYYILKPYKHETIEMIMPRLLLLQQRQHKSIFLQMFGRFVIMKDGQPIHLVGKAKEILALIATRQGKEISNEEIYSTIWETRAYDNISMKVYYNALKRLKEALKQNGISDILKSTARGQILDTSLVDCDYYSWKENRMTRRDRFDGDFLSEYSWGEYILSDILEKEGVFDFSQ